MARINIEDQFFLDVINVAAKMGNSDAAIGNAIRFFRYAQEKHKAGKTISEEEFEAQGFSEHLIPVFAKRTRSGIEANGAKKHFAWLEQKIEAGKRGGRASAKARERKVGTSKPSNRKQLEAKPSDAEPSPSPSPSFSNSSSLEVTAGVAALEPAGPTAVSETWRAYEEEYQKRYRVKPTRNAKVMSQVAQFCKRVPAAEAPSIVRYFLSHPKSFYVQKLHEFGLCLADAESLRTQFLAQTMVTDSMLSEYRKRATETRTRGIAEILADKELNQPQLISRKVANDAE